MSTQQRSKEAALKTLGGLQVIYGPHPHEYRLATPEEFPHFDRAFYDRMQEWFALRGYRNLGDCENMTLSRVYPKLRTLIRRMGAPNGEILVSLHSLRTRRKGFPEFHKTIDLETELSDGTFIVTDNTLIATVLPSVPLIDRLQFPGDTDPEFLLGAHSDRIAKQLVAKPGISATRISTIEEVHKFQQRVHAIESHHRRQVGYMTRDDFTKIYGRPPSNAQKILVEEFEKLTGTES